MFIANTKDSESSLLGAFRFFRVSQLDVRPIMDPAVQLDEQFVRETRKVVHEMANVTLPAKVCAFMLQCAQELPQSLFRWRFVGARRRFARCCARE
jgi:hypothetical protein